MELFESVPVQALHLTPETVRQVAEWIVPPEGNSGYSWYEGSAARFRTDSGEVIAAMGDWIVRLGSTFVALSEDEFGQLFRATDCDAPARETTRN